MNYGKTKDYLEELNQIRKLALNLRSLRPSLDTSWITPVDWEVKWSNINGRSAKSLTLTLTPSGCTWAKEGGCTMCGEYEGSAKGAVIPAMYHIAQFAKAAGVYVQKFNPDWLRIYQEGNYVNDNEVDSDVQIDILRIASAFRGIKRITIEAMAKYISYERIAKLREAVPSDVELEIGMGFEGEDDVVRNICVNKGETLEDYKRAISILRENNVRSLAYVVLKPPFLTENEAIEEAIKTISKANDMKFDAISLQPLTIHKYSLAHALYSVGEYDLPWLWSVMEVGKSIDFVNDFRIGGLGFYPRPINAAHNRHTKSDGENDCNPVLWEAIREYGKMRDRKIFDSFNCRCKNKWYEVCDEQDVDLHTRIKRGLSKIDLNVYEKKFNNQDPLFPNMISVDGDTYFMN